MGIAVLRLMAQAQEGMMKKDSALYYYGIIVEKEPQDYLSVAKLANLHIEFNEARFLRIALKYDPKNINVLYYLGRACAKTSWKTF